MQISRVVPQLRTTDLAASIEFYTTKLGFTFEFQYEDFYAGVRSGNNVLHLKLIDAPDPSIAFVERNTSTSISTRPMLQRRRMTYGATACNSSKTYTIHRGAPENASSKTNAGHTLYFGHAFNVIADASARR